jgi:hypothetical protein
MILRRVPRRPPAEDRLTQQAANNRRAGRVADKGPRLVGLNGAITCYGLVGEFSFS